MGKSRSKGSKAGDHENRCGPCDFSKTEIKRFQEGLYVFFTYDGPGDVSLELERRFKQTEAVIRFMTVLKDPRDLGRRKNRKKRAEEAAQAAAPASATTASPAPAEVKEEK